VGKKHAQRGVRIRVKRVRVSIRRNISRKTKILEVKTFPYLRGFEDTLILYKATPYIILRVALIV